MVDNNQNQNPEQQSIQNAKNASRPVARKGLKAAANVGKKAGKLLLKALAGAVKAFLPFILIVVAILFIGWLSYNLVFEWRGTEREHYQWEQNPAEMVNGIYMANESEMTDSNKIIKDFYKYFGETSVWKLVGSNNTDFLKRDSKKYEEMIDFYEREDLFALNNHMLISLDDYLYGEQIRNPEQFIRPINYDPDTMSLLPLADESDNIIVDADVIDMETGKKTGESIKSVRDYGLASIVKYNEKEQYTRTLKIIGEYYKEDYWDSASGEVKKRNISEPIEGLVLDGYPKDINLIDRAVTFQGSIEYIYEYKDVEFRNLDPKASKKENAPYAEYIYDTHKEPYDCEEVVIGYNEETGEEITDTKCKYKYYDLKKYRSADTKVFEYVPVIKDTITNEDTSNYFEDYLLNFESYVHVDHIGDELLFERINYDSSVFEGIEDIENTVYNGSFKKNTTTNTTSYENAAMYYGIVKEYAEEFDVDPKIIIAMIAQESGGDTNISKGLAQITFGKDEHTKDASAVNKNGDRVYVSVEKDEVNDPYKAIEYMVVRYAQLYQMYDDDLKAIQAYNFGPGTMLKVKDISKEDWESDNWISHLETARAMQSPNTRSASYTCRPNPGFDNNYKAWGDSCYISNVLRYYTGNEIDEPDINATEDESFGNKVAGFFDGLFEGVWDTLFPITTDYKEGEHIEYLPLVHETVPDDVLRVTSAFNNQTLFSDTSIEGVNFYSSGFFSIVNSPYMSFNDVANMTPGGKGFIWPAPSDVTRISSPYGYRIHPIWKDRRLHTGIDIPIELGRAVYAIGDGEVTDSRYMRSYGNTVFIYHGNGVESRYAHNSRLPLKVGDKVKQGDVIAYAGSSGDSTGPHIHFEIRVNGTPVDPVPWILNKGL